MFPGTYISATTEDRLLFPSRWSCTYHALHQISVEIALGGRNSATHEDWSRSAEFVANDRTVALSPSRFYWKSVPERTSYKLLYQCGWNTEVGHDLTASSMLVPSSNAGVRVTNRRGRARYIPRAAIKRKRQVTWTRKLLGQMAHTRHQTIVCFGRRGRERGWERQRVRSPETISQRSGQDATGKLKLRASR